MDSKLPLWTADGLSHGVTDYTPSQAEANNDISSQCEIVITEGSSGEMADFSNVCPQSIHCKEPVARMQGIVPEVESSLTSSTTYTNYASMAFSPDCPEDTSGTTSKPKKYSNFSVCRHPGREDLRLVPKDYLERIDSMTSNMYNSVNNQAAAAQQQTDGNYLDPLFDDSSANEKKVSDPSCNVLLSVAAQNSCKVVRKEENRGTHILYDTSTCSQSYSYECLSSDTNNTSTMITNTDTATNNSQRIAQNILNVGKAYDTTDHYNFLGQSQSLTISPNSETGTTGIFSLESTSKERKSESNRRPQTPTDSIVKESAQIKPYKDNLTRLLENEHKIDSNNKTSFVNLCSVSTHVTMMKRVWHSYEKRKLLKMAKVLSAIQEPSKNITAHSGKFSTDMKKVKMKAGKTLLHNRREDRCCRKSGKVKRPTLVTENRQNRCVKTSKMFGHHTNVSAGTEPNNSQEGSSKLLDGFKDPVKAEISNEKHDMAQSSAKDLQSNITNTLLKTVFTEKAPNTELNGDAAFELSMQSTINNIGLHFCTSNAFNNRVKDESSGIPFMGVSVNASDDHPGELSEMGICIKNSLSGSNAISAKHSPIQKVDGFTRYCDEDCVTTLNKDTYTVADSAKSTKKAKKYINCKYCQRTFRHISAYMAHQRIHTGEKPYRCELCGKNFAQPSKLRSHRNGHVHSMSWPCPCCTKKFSIKKDLVIHFTAHVNGSKQNTEPDQQGSKSEAPLRDPTLSNGILFNVYNQFNNSCERKIKKHDWDKLISCSTCGKEFWTSSQLVVHERTHWPVKPYACSICGKGFKQIKALKKHSQKHTGETTFSCSHCGCAFCDLAALRVHQISKLCNRKQNLKGKNGDIEGFLVTYGVDGQVNTPVFFKCQICKQLYQTWCQYTLHLQTHTKSPPYLCFACGQSYINNSEVKVHCGVCCQTSGEEAVCGSSISEILHSNLKKCTNLKDNSQTDMYSMGAPKSNSLSSAGQIHKNSLTWNNLPTEYLAPKFPQFVKALHLPETVYLSNNDQLPSSPTPSVISCAFLNNSLDWGEGPSLLRFKCSRCGQRYKRYRNLCLHMRTHAPAFRYVCRHCGHSYKRWNKLWLHQRIHRWKGRCFTCSQCNLQFNLFSSYKMHLLNHAKEKPYACPLCPKTFACKEGLHIHQCSFHQPKRKLQCDVCARSFSNLTNFIKHNLLHNGARSHQWFPCNRSFTNNKSLQEHLKTHNTASLLPSIPSEPFTFLHKCNICKSSFSNGDLLYAHQICHSRDLKCLVRSTKRSESTSVGLKGLQSTTRRSLLSTLDLDAIPNDIFKYPHPDKLYLPTRLTSMFKCIPIINLDSVDKDIPQEASTAPVSSNSETGQNNSDNSQCTETEMPLQLQALENQESIQSLNSEEIPVLHTDIVTDTFQNKASHNITQTIEIVETSVVLEGPTTTVNAADNEIQDETFKCADCSEKLGSVVALYEHYFLHALGKKSL